MPAKPKTNAKAAIEKQEHQDPVEAPEDLKDWDGPFGYDTSEESEDDLPAPAPESFESQTPISGQSFARISGSDLLEFYATRKAAGRTHAQIAYDAGYYTITKAGHERVMQAQFNEAYLAAQGVEIGDGSSGPGRSHAGLSKARVSGQGILLVSQLATRHVGAKPGDVYSVSYPGGGQILLMPTDEVKPVVHRKNKSTEEQPDTPLLDQTESQEA
jgi:hypothetical protein